MKVFITKIFRWFMDKKMKKVTAKVKQAEQAIKHGKKQEAIKDLHQAEEKNEKLTQYDKNVRDPMIEKYEKIKKKK